MRQAVIVAAVVVVCAVVAPRPGAAFKQVACPLVISELNRISRTEDKMILAMEKTARKLGTSPIWIENCMRAYGRPIPQNVTIDQDFRERLLERMEEVDIAPEDMAPEERAEPDPIYEERETGGFLKRKPNEYIQKRPVIP
jgi:hypothetical protein